MMYVCSFVRKSALHDFSPIFHSVISIFVLRLGIQLRSEVEVVRLCPITSGAD